MESIDASLKLVLEWAQDKLEGQQEPPWAVPQYEQLKTTLAAILQSRATTITLEGLRQQELPLETAHPQAENIVELDIARLRRGKLVPPLPM